MFNAVAAIGEQALLDGFRLVGVSVFGCFSDEDILDAWKALPEDTSIVLLTPHSAQALEPVLADPCSPMTVVLPS